MARLLGWGAASGPSSSEPIVGHGDHRSSARYRLGPYRSHHTHATRHDARRLGTGSSGTTSRTHLDPARTETRTIDMHIMHLRAKLRDRDQRLLETVRGKGYRFHHQPGPS